MIVQIDNVLTFFPTIPGEFIPSSNQPQDFDLQCRTLWEMVLDELLDDDYKGRQHHNTGTHDRGCRGPLCRKSYREHPRRRTPDGFSGYTPREERIYDPILEYFHTVGKFRIKKYLIMQAQSQETE